MRIVQAVAVLLMAAALAACGESAPLSSDLGNEGRRALSCLLDDPRRQVGEGLDAPGRVLDVPVPPLGATSGPCAGNTAFEIGVGRADTTGEIADTSSPAWVNPQQVMSGLHSRLYARAFALGSPCNGQRVLFVSIDMGLMSAELRNAVLAAVAADPLLAPHYDGRNVMLSVTHTHADPGTAGQGFATAVNGILSAMRQAQSQLKAQPVAGRLRLASGELLNTNLNRSKPAYAMNAAVERQAFLNVRNEEVQVNKRMVQVELVDAQGQALGLINWFGVHPTIIGPSEPLVSGDMKGFAALTMERLMRGPEAPAAIAGDYVAAFAQADEGDSSPNLRIEEFPHPDPRRGGGVDDYDAHAISGIKHVARALELREQATALTGPVDVHYAEIPISAITVDDPAVLAQMAHPAELDAVEKRTCDGILGASFGAGAEDGPGPTVEGLNCNDPDLLNAATGDLNLLINTRLRGFPGGWPAELIPGNLLSAALLCNIALLPPVLGDFGCHAEKPVLLPRGADVLPFQMFRLGNLLLVGMPWEVTTMAARRLRSLLLDELAPVGVDTVVIAGLVNDYAHYLTTREEYAAQQYEGASTLYGPWTLAAVSQESLHMARALRDGTPMSVAPPVAAVAAEGASPPAVDLPHPAGPVGTITEAPSPVVAPGDLARASLVAGHPRNDLRTGDSYVFVERETADGWVPVAQDRDPELVYTWNPIVPLPVAVPFPVQGPGTASALWTVPRNTPPGRYRFRFEGRSRPLPLLDATAYTVMTPAFTVAGAVLDCP
jgi:neutral ceramidase